MKEEITFDEIEKMDADEYIIVDIRGKEAFEYGHVTGSINIPDEGIYTADLDKNKQIFVLCRSGVISDEVAEKMRDLGFKASNLKGGYVEWLRRKINETADEDTAKRVEDSIKKKFHKKLFSRFWN
jgi:rhodanese-related sulfurtransferase